MDVFLIGSFVGLRSLHGAPGGTGLPQCDVRVAANGTFPGFTLFSANKAGSASEYAATSSDFS